MGQPDRKEVALAMKKAMSPADLKEDMMLILAPHMNWQEMLNPAPLSVCLLGQLLLVTLERDVSLVSEHMARPAFKHVKYPDSLRASMVQVANQGWTAFNCANKNMDIIRLMTLQVPQHVKNAVKFIIGGSNEEVQELVPDILNNVIRIADTCQEKAEEVENQFTDVMELIGELQEACTVAKGTHDENLRRANAEDVLKTKRKEAAEAKKRRSEEEYKEMKSHLEKARESYEKAIESMPSISEVVGYSILEGLGKAVGGAVEMGASALSMKSLKGLLPTKKGSSTSGGGSPALVNNERTDLLLQEVPILSEWMNQLMELGSGLTEGKNVDEQITQAEVAFKDVTAALQKYTGKEQKTIADITASGSELLRLMKTSSKQMTKGSKQEQAMKDITKGLSAKVNGLEIFCKNAFGGAPMQSPLPRMSSVEQSSPGSATEAYSKQCRFKVEQAAVALEAAREDFKEANKKIEDSNEKVTQLITELSKIQIDKVNFEEIKELLKKGIRALGEVKTQWGKLVRFFETMANIIKCCMNENVKSFVSYAEQGKNFRLKYGLSDMLRDTIYTQASEANKIAFMVNNLAGMYVEVSERHLMDQVASLGTLLALDPEKDRQAIINMQQTLREEAEAATRSIAQLVGQKQKEFDTRIQRRIEKIETEMRAVLPPPVAVDPIIESEKRKAVEKAKAYKAETKVDVDDWVCTE